MTPVQISGQNPIDEKIRLASMKKINKLSTDELDKIAQLAESAKARDYIKNKFNMLKAFLKF